ncbi:amidophosphoribosyltransferase [Caldalkalibacillus thermarum]|uniref:ComF family protein n=1 Tax=Caldalkalibacillus thermarum TaxID=296745 RepID=UPI0016655B0B|nr:ComF family protein [Caldalkalibacillus thermarum]GGK36189.1 amidophosphoribosyltransferase [Caldalkalibacillus thermarum]
MPKRCLVCQHERPHVFSWTALLRLAPFRRDLLPPLHAWLCSACEAEADWIGTGCSRCFRPLEHMDQRYVKETEQGLLCYDCQRWLEWENKRGAGSVLDWNRSVLRYNAWTQELIARYKFRGDERLKYFFAAVIREHARQQGIDTGQIDLVTAIPLSSGRLSERGFNQSDLIARLVAETWQRPYRSELLQRQGAEEKQSKKGRQARMEKILTMFLNNPACQADIINKRIMVIDDIYTTGATVHAAALALKRGGAKQVFSYTVAR